MSEAPSYPLPSAVLRPSWANRRSQAFALLAVAAFLAAIALRAPIRLDAFIGKPTVVNLWATWCGPCVREMPVLHQAQLDHPAVNFVFVNQGEQPERVGAWLKHRSLPLRNVLIDGKGEAGSAFDQRALPTSLFFDARGQWVATRIGELSRATLTEKLQAASR